MQQHSVRVSAGPSTSLALRTLSRPSGSINISSQQRMRWESRSPLHPLLIPASTLPPRCTITAARQTNASHPSVSRRTQPDAAASPDMIKIQSQTSQLQRPRYAINRAAARSDGTTTMQPRPDPSAHSTQSRTHFAETAAIHFCSSFLSKCSSMPSTGISCCWYFLSRCSRNCSNTFLRYT
jgi:hypothetical protein